MFYKRPQSTLTHGFTLIELLVVIAILGLLASVILPSLRVGNKKAVDSTIKYHLSSLRSQSEIYLSNNGNYGQMYVSNFCPTLGSASIFGDPKIHEFISELNSINNNQTRCAAGGTGTTPGPASSWAVLSPLQSTSGFWCSDSGGNSRVAKTRWSFLAWLIPDAMAQVIFPNLGGGLGVPARCP